MGVIVHGGAADETGFTDDGTDIRLTTITDEVGIGTLTPDTQLEISKDSANAEVTISAYHNTDATTPKLTLRKADGSEASPALVGDNAVLGTISFQGHDGAGGFEQGAKIEARANGTPSGGTDMPAELSFWTTPEASATAVQRATILADGKVGIGQPAPTSALHVKDATNITPDGNSVGHIQIEGTGYAGCLALDATGMWLSHNSAARSLLFATDETERMRIDGAGKVGIGVAGPVTALEIVSDDDLQTFTGTGRGMLTLTNADYDADDILAIDFRYTGGASEEPSARIGARTHGGGTDLVFGTSNTYAGITNEGLTINNAGQTCVQTGSAAAPSLAFLGDENTGLYNVSGNRIGFATAGSLKAAVTSSGYFYVGTTGGADMAGTDGYFSVKKATNALAAYITSSTATHIIAEFMSDHGGAGADQLRIMCDGDIETDGSVGALSDERLKTVLEARDYYEDLRKLEVVNFHLVKRVKRNHVYDDDGEQIGEPTYEIVDREEPSKKHLGLVAQQVEEHIPGLVKMGADGVRVLKYSVLTPMLLQAFQKLATKAETLEAKVEALEAKVGAVEAMEERIAALENANG